MKNFQLRHLIGLLVLFSVLLQWTASPLLAQKKYRPDSPEVEAIVNKAIKFLQSKPPSNEGELTLAALAIVEAGKRYQADVHANDPLVKAAIAKILAGFADQSILKSQEVYYPCLAMILLAEVDQSKYKTQVKQMLDALEKRQRPWGAFTYLGQDATGDTSQTQYAALAFFVAKQHGFAFNPEVPKKALEWLVRTQQRPGFWIYMLNFQGPQDLGQPTANSIPGALSIHAAGLSTAYLLSDLLQLVQRKKSLDSTMASEGLVGLPKTVSVYVKPVDGENAMLNKTGPLVNFEMGGLHGAFSGGNDFLEKNFTVSLDKSWTFYYLYALERYAWFREQSEGDLGNDKISTWYDQGVEFLKKDQQGSGAFSNKSFPQETSNVATAFAILFLVRSSEVISLPSSETEMAGGEGFPDDELRVEGGALVSSDAEKNLSDMMGMLEGDLTPAQMESLTKSLKKAVMEFKSQDNKSRSEIKSFLRTMIAAREYYRRKIAVRFLAGEQDMDNVPALIYALGDPDFRVAIEAHDGLRLISRRIDSLSVTDETRKNALRGNDVLTPAEESSARMEFASIKKKWTEWFLKIRPDAEMLD